MCNIAGYVGRRRAAPILIEMIRRQQGFAGGFFTGIATLHEGKLYYEKLTGDLEHLLAKTEAGALPGNIGIMHSRSYCDGTGGNLWAHPFIGRIGGRAATAYVANGIAGRFAARNEEYMQLAEQLMRQGYAMPRIRVESNKYTKFPDGSSVHMSDVMCQLITRNIAEGGDPVSSMGDAFCRMPAEIVGLMLSQTEPDGIVWSRINRPMMLSFSEHGAYLATTAMAFPEDRGEVQSLPPLASGCVYRDRVVSTPYTEPPVAVGAVDPPMIARAYELICAALSKQTMRFSEIEKLAATLFSPSDCPQDALVSYEILRALKARGKLNVQTRHVPGAAEGLTAPKFVFTLK